MKTLIEPIQQVVALAAAKFEAQQHKAPNRASINVFDFARRDPAKNDLLPNLILAADPEVAEGTAYVYFDEEWHQQMVDSGLIDELGEGEST